MYIKENGVSEKSNVYFHTPSSIAKSTFFYMKYAGEFFCSEGYRVARENYHCYLIMYVRKGSGIVEFDNKTYVAKANDVILLNCNKPHLYTSTPEWETLWIHYDGISSQQFFDLLHTRFGVVLPLGNSIVIPRHLSMIIDGFRNNKPIPEAIVSSCIHRMLSEMVILSSDYSEQNMQTSNPVLDAVTFIEMNSKDKLSLTDLASHVSISPFHFSRLFKKETGYTPYEFIIKTRIDKAKTLLKKSDLSIKAIAFEVGYNSESNFTNTFHAHVHLTPKEFRRTPL